MLVLFALASNPVLHAWTKHIELDAHFVRDKVKDKRIELQYILSFDQIVDMLTKPLGYQFFSRLTNNLSLCSLSVIELRRSECVKIQSVHEDTTPNEDESMHSHAQARKRKNEKDSSCCVGVWCHLSMPT